MRPEPEATPGLLADDLAYVMAGRGLSTFDVAEDADVDVDDVRGCLTQRFRLVSSYALARLSLWVAEQRRASAPVGSMGLEPANHGA